MNLDTQKILKTLFTSCLVIALVKVKSSLEQEFHNQDVFLYFVLFLISLFILSIIEVMFDKMEESNWLKKVTNRREYIQGTWLNYAMDVESGDIYNFALLQIDCIHSQIQIDGWTFRASMTTDKRIMIVPDGHFSSTIAQYQRGSRSLGFDFIVDISARVIACKHQIFGSAKYFFLAGKQVPATFQGEFSTQDPASFCHVIGHRLNERLIPHSAALIDRYKMAIGVALERNWIDSNKIPKARQSA